MDKGLGPKSGEFETRHVWAASLDGDIEFALNPI